MQPIRTENWKISDWGDQQNGVSGCQEIKVGHISSKVMSTNE